MLEILSKSFASEPAFYHLLLVLLNTSSGMAFEELHFLLKISEVEWESFRVAFRLFLHENHRRCWTIASDLLRATAPVVLSKLASKAFCNSLHERMAEALSQSSSSLRQI